jgi:hypothetical protein
LLGIGDQFPVSDPAAPLGPPKTEVFRVHRAGEEVSKIIAVLAKSPGRIRIGC